MDYNADLRRRTVFASVGLGLVITVGFILFQFRATLVFTLFLYYASRPIYRKLGDLPVPKRLQGRHLPYRRQAAAVTTIAVFLLPFLVLLFYTLILVLPEIQQFVGKGGPGARYISALQSAQGSGRPAPLAGLQISDFLTMNPEELVTIFSEPAVQAWVERIATTLISSVGLFANAVLHAFIVLAGTYYLLTDGSRAVNWVLENFDETGVVESYAVSVDDELSAILFGNILNAVVTGIIGILVFTAYNLIAPTPAKVPFAPLVGALTGAGSLIPVVGMKIVYIPVGLVLAAAAAVAAGQPSAIGFVLLFLLITFVFVDTIPDFVIRPYVSGKRTHIGLLMFAYILGPIVFGFYGIFLGPILLVLFAQFFRTIAPYVLTGKTAENQSTLSDY